MSKRLAVSVAAVMVLAAVPVALSTATSDAAPKARGGSTLISLYRVGTATMSRGGLATGELRVSTAEDAAGATKAVANRSPKSHAKVLRGTPPLSGIVPTQTLDVSSSASGFQGINHYEQRYADGGNQWSLVPPDQGLCAGNGQVVEAVNNAIQVYDEGGASLLPHGAAISVNQFYWRDHEVVRSPVFIASTHQMGDLSCVYDAGSGRFFMAAYDLVSDTSGNPTGPSFVDVAVSNNGDATKGWTIYQLDTSSIGLADHDGCPCFGDYPHIGTDANGFYVSTNEYSTLGSAYNGANIYAFGKDALVASTGSSSPQALMGVMFGTKGADPYGAVTYDGFTLAPALSSGTDYADNTMYFLSSDAWSGDVPITSHRILVWQIADTHKLGSSDASSLQLTHTTVRVDGYYPPPASDQKKGSVPLADCLNWTACSKAVLGRPDKYKEYEFAFDSSDTRMLQSAYANGRVWGALGTAVDVDGATKAGIAYYVINPTGNEGAPSLVKSGTLAVAGNNISYPALGVTSSGKAVMAMTLVGKDWFPSAAYVTLDDRRTSEASDVTVVGKGLGPEDDFSGYRGFEYNRPRWGDYGAAAVIGDKVWIASEYVAQTCTLAQFVATSSSASFGSCDNTRSVLANWSTHIAVVDTATSG